MDITTVKAFFMWCTIINTGLLISSSLACILLGDFSYLVWNRFFSISREAFNVAGCCFIAFFKLFVIVFNLTPYIALVIIG